MSESVSVRAMQRSLSTNVVTLLSAALTFVVGLTCLVGWHFGSETLTQIMPGLPPLRYNPAVALVLTAIGLVLAVLDRPRLTRLCGTAVGIVGLATLVEYAVGGDLGIDQLVIGDGSPDVSGDSGRMALAAAICLVGAAVAVMPQRPAFRGRPLLLACLGIAVFGFGIAGFLGAAAPYQAAYAWFRLPRIALHAAVAFMAIGVGIADYGWRQRAAGQLLIRDLRNSIIIYTTFGMLLMIVIAAIIAVLPTYGRLCAAQHNYLLHTARSRAAAVEQYVLRVESIALQIASRTRARQLLEAYQGGELSRDDYVEQTEPILRDALRNAREVHGIARLDRQGELLKAVGAPIPRNRWPQQVSGMETPVVDGPVLLDDEPHLVVAVPILDADGRRLGIDVLLVRFASVGSILADPSRLGISTQLLFEPDASGKIAGLALTPDREQVRLIEPTDADRALVKESARERSAVWKTEPAGRRPLLKSFASVGGTDWVIVSAVGVDELYYPVNRQLFTVFWVVAGLAVLSAAGIYLLLRPWTGGILMETGLLEQRVRDATAALAKSEERFDLAVRGTDAGIWDWDLRTNKVYFSPRWKSMLGFSEDEIGDDPDEWVRRIQPDDRAGVLEKVRAYQSGEIPQYEVEHRLLGKDGNYRWILARGTVVRDAAGQPYRMVGSHIEITDRKAAEERLKSMAEALGQSNRDLEQFAYIASHDLQEPLRMMSSYLQLLAQQYREQLPSHAQTLIDLSLDSGRRMQQLVNDLLAYSRVQTREIELQPVDMREVFGETVENLQLTIAENGAAVTCDELPTVRGDHSQLVQLLQNLVGNGIKFHGEQPPRVHISAERSGDFWTLSVRDHGIGIDPEYAETVFEVFQRLHTSDAYPGTGIGLAVCKRIVQRHGGRIWFESEVCKGTTFFFTLPTAAAPEEGGRNGADRQGRQRSEQPVGDR